ncbi:MAG: hypothetical protein M3P98_01050 [bacterium]|nr:hypothetical protein [bacterium]
MKAILNLSRRKPLIVSLVLILGVAIFFSSYIIRKNQISNEEFQEESLGVNVVSDPLDNSTVMIDLTLDDQSLTAVIGSDSEGECVLTTSLQRIVIDAEDSRCVFENVDLSVEEISVTYVSKDGLATGIGKIRL